MYFTGQDSLSWAAGVGVGGLLTAGVEEEWRGARGRRKMVRGARREGVIGGIIGLGGQAGVWFFSRRLSEASLQGHDKRRRLFCCRGLGSAQRHCSR